MGGHKAHGLMPPVVTAVGIWIELCMKSLHWT